MGARSARNRKNGANGKSARIGRTGWSVTLGMSGSRNGAVPEKCAEEVVYAQRATSEGIDGWVETYPSILFCEYE
jgi:hypothetical protein